MLNIKLGNFLILFLTGVQSQSISVVVDDPPVAVLVFAPPVAVLMVSPPVAVFVPVEKSMVFLNSYPSSLSCPLCISVGIGLKSCAIGFVS